jgi:dihydrofolate synthase/folylpolyglutamate synthase
MSRPTTLPAWLAYLETLHPKAIAMGLDRVRAVQARMNLALDCPVVTVTGTNGKGSTCAMLEAIYRAAGYRVGVYASPHLMRYNERVRVEGCELADEAIVTALNAVEDARTAPGAVDRTPTPLTYFEFGTLAALWLLTRADLDVAILEVGLGGRLDAVNIVDADIAVVTSIDLDHMDYLGPTREDIGREKAGIFRANHPAVCGEPAPPRSLVEHALRLDAPLALIGRDFGFAAESAQWEFWGPGGRRHGLPHPALRGAHQLANAATALAVIDLMQPRLPVSAGAVRDGLVAVTLPGRFQVLAGRPAIVLDVAHNPHAAQVLAAAARAMGYFPETRGVFGMLADKDVAGVAAQMRRTIDRWYVATLPGPRGASAAALAAALARAGVAPAHVRCFDDVVAAVDAAQEGIGEADRIIVFGSFLTVAAALAALVPGTSRAPRHG